jgi:hypothetical protein
MAKESDRPQNTFNLRNILPVNTTASWVGKLPIFLLVFLLGTTFIAYWTVEQKAKFKAEAVFSAMSKDIETRIIKRLQEHEKLLITLGIGGVKITSSDCSMS